MQARILTTDFSVDNKTRKISLAESNRRWTTTLLFSLTASVLSGLAGTIINGLFLSGILKNNTHLETLGIWLTVAAFPLAALTAHCLDKIERAKKIARRARFQRKSASGKNYHQFSRPEKIFAPRLVKNPARGVFVSHG